MSEEHVLEIDVTLPSEDEDDNAQNREDLYDYLNKAWFDDEMESYSLTSVNFLAFQIYMAVAHILQSAAARLTYNDENNLRHTVQIFFFLVLIALRAKKISLQSVLAQRVYLLTTLSVFLVQLCLFKDSFNFQFIFASGLFALIICLISFFLMIAFLRGHDLPVFYQLKKS